MCILSKNQVLVVNNNVLNQARPAPISTADFDVDLRKPKAISHTPNETEPASSNRSNAREYLDSPEPRHDVSSESSVSQGKLKNQHYSQYSQGPTLQPIIEMRIEDTAELERQRARNALDSARAQEEDDLACEEEIDHQSVAQTMDFRDQKTTLKSIRQYDSLFDHTYLDQLKATSQNVKHVHNSQFVLGMEQSA